LHIAAPAVGESTIGLFDFAAPARRLSAGLRTPFSQRKKINLDFPREMPFSQFSAATGAGVALLFLSEKQSLP
jgi:hypothetical protein